MQVWPYYMKTRGKRPPRQFLLYTIALCAPLQERLKNASLVAEVEATGNFSYACDRTHGPGYLLLGDAYTFIDPVFSSGVLLAMNSAFMGAEVVDTFLRRPRRLGRIRLFRQGAETRTPGVLVVYLPGNQPDDA
jgi:small ligand-binding sensory domain FIST